MTRATLKKKKNEKKKDSKVKLMTALDLYV